MVKDCNVYIQLLLDSISKIEDFVAGLSVEQFLNDQKTQSAVLMQFQIIGELAKKVPDTIRKDIDVPWKEIAGFRDIIAHDYFTIDATFVWQTLSVDIPELKEKVTEYLTSNYNHPTT